jgi:hypothetical protein
MENGMSEACSTHGGDESALNILVAKPEGKRQLGRPRRRWEDNIRIALRDTVWERVGRMHLAPDTGWWYSVVNTVMNFRVP